MDYSLSIMVGPTTPYKNLCQIIRPHLHTSSKIVFIGKHWQFAPQKSRRRGDSPNHHISRGNSNMRNSPGKPLHARPPGLGLQSVPAADQYEYKYYMENQILDRRG